MRLAALLLVAVHLCGCDTRTCLRQHDEVRQSAGWTQFMIIGKSIFPIYHPPTKGVVTVCDEYAEDPRG